MKKRSKKHKILIIIALCVFLLALATLTLPYWLPKSYIKATIEKQMTSQMNRQTKIDSLKLSWTQGIEIQGINVARHSDFGIGQLMRIGKFQCEFDLFGLKARHLELAVMQDVDVNVVVLPDGRVNVMELPPLQIDFDRFDYQQMTVGFFLKNEKILTLYSNGQVWINNLNNKFAWNINASQKSGSDPAITSFGKNGDVPDYLSPGDAKIPVCVDITNFDLSRIILNEKLKSLLADFGINPTGITGRLSANLTTRFNPDISLNANLNLAVNNLTVKSEQGDIFKDFSIATKINSIISQDYIEAQSTFASSEFNTAGEFSYDFGLNSLNFELKDSQLNFDKIFQTLPFLNNLQLAQQLKPRGNLKFNLNCTPGSFTRASFEIDATDMGFDLEYAIKPAGIPFVMQGKLNKQANKIKLDINDSQLSTATMRAQIIIQDIFAQAIKPNGTVRINFEDVAQFGNDLCFPISENIVAGGPMVFDLDFHDDTLAASAVMAGDSSCHGYYQNQTIFAKELGQQLKMNVQGRWPTNQNTFENISADVSVGQGNIQLQAHKLILTDQKNIAQLDADIELKNIDSLKKIFPFLQKMLIRKQINLDGDLQANINFEQSPTKNTLHSKLDLTNADFCLQDNSGKFTYHKLMNFPAHIDFDLTENIVIGYINGKVAMDIDGLNLNVKGCFRKDFYSNINLENQLLPFNLGSYQFYDATLIAETDHCEKLFQAFPDFDGSIKVKDHQLENLTGKIKLGFKLNHANNWQAKLGFDATEADFDIIVKNKKQEFHTYNKISQQPCKLNTNFEIKINYDLMRCIFPGFFNSQPMIIANCLSLDFLLDKSRLSASGSLYLDESVGDVYDYNYFTSIYEGNFNVNSNIQSEQILDLVFAGYDDLPQLQGAAQFDGIIKWDSDSVDIQSNLDLTNTEIKHKLEIQDGPQHFNKPATEKLDIAFDAAYDKNKSKLNLNRIKINALDNVIAIAIKDDQNYNCNFNITDGQSLIGWLDNFPVEDFQTQLSGDIALTVKHNSPPEFYIHSIDCMGTLGGQYKSQDFVIAFDKIKFCDNLTLLDNLQFKLNQNDVNVNAHLTNLSVFDKLDKYPSGEIFLNSQNLDIDQMQADIKILDFTNSSDTDFNAEAIVKYLKQCNIQVNANISNLGFTDPENEVFLQPKQLKGKFSIADQQLLGSVITSVNAGVYSVDINCDLAEEKPILKYSMQSNALMASPALCRIVENKLPGLILQGDVSEKYDFQTSLYDVFNMEYCWTGKGQTVLNDGLTIGSGGPGWMQKIIPSLKTSQYQWQKMTCKFDQLADGSRNNHLVFQGDKFDLYMNGTTIPVRNSAEYDKAIGLLNAELKLQQSQLELINQNKINVTDTQKQYYRQRLNYIQQLIAKDANGTKLKINYGDYLIGLTTAIASDKPFGTPKQFLPVPVFRNQGYIAGGVMFGIENTSF
ncbi:MAG: hypothetical protein JEZ07_00695 [Phycisphaerae bacterium]|nr:hypothetical protein [Phycisphaerae bacterium]